MRANWFRRSISHFKKYTCPCCGWKTLDEKPPGTFDICPICFWEDDNLQFDDPDYAGGANRVSLRQAQKNFFEFGAKERRVLDLVRRPTKKDERDPEWRRILPRGIKTIEQAKRSMKEYQRRQKTELGQRVSKILFNIDPMELSAPEDEYGSEAEMIVERLSAGEPLSTQLVQIIFERMFGSELDPEICEKVVRALEPVASEIINQRR